jgi:hypothetical protein
MLSATHKYEGFQGLTGEQPHPFAFPITWNSLTASLELDESIGSTSKSPLEVHLELELLELVAAPRPSVPPSPPSANGRWEMVVPQMVRTHDRTFEPVGESQRSVPPPADPRLLPPPLFASFQTQSLFSRAASMFGKRTHAMLESPAAPAPPPLPPPKPAVSAAEMEARRAARELLLSKIAKSVRGRGDEP